MKSILRLFSIATVLAIVFPAKAVIPLDYYSSLQGLKGAELKDAIHQLVAKSPEIKMLDYGSGTNKTWWAFYITDRRDDNTCVDRYSYETFYFGERGKSISGTNIEHSFAKSWWGGATNNAYKDLFNLMPCESSINQSKSNYPMGVVVKVTTAKGDNGCTKVGNGADGKKYWEPADEWKGDFARGYMYMATAYQDYEWVATECEPILENNTYPTLTKAAYDLYLQWARQDDVAEIEVLRCNQVQEFQHNRNPYVDFPNLMEYVWGDSINTPFDLLTTRKSDICTGIEPLYQSTFLGTTGDCTVSTAVNPGFNVWTNSESYGWVAKASRGSSSNLTYYAADASLVLPEIDLTDYESAYVEFEHAVNFAAAPANMLQVVVREKGGDSHVINDKVTWPAGTGWTFVSSGQVDLKEFTGKVVTVEFRYTSTTSEACTWEIKNLKIVGVQRHVDPVAPVYGDVNGDGVTNSNDIGMLINIILGNSVDDTNGRADVNNDKVVNSNDIGVVINVILGLVQDPQIPQIVTGDGSQENPYQCWQVIDMNPSSTTEAAASGVWVEGYIVGYYNSYKTYFNLEETPVNHNILLSDNRNTTNKSECIDVQLVNKTTVRTDLNLVDHPEMLGCKVRVFGDIYKYNQMPGVKNTSNYTK